MRTRIAIIAAILATAAISALATAGQIFAASAPHTWLHG